MRAKSTRVFYIYRTKRKSMWTAYKTGLSHSTFLYGLPELKKKGYQVEFSDAAYSPFNLLRYLLQPLENLNEYFLNYPIGFKLHQALLLWPKYRKADVIIATQDSAGLPILLLKLLGLVSPPVLYISNGLANSFQKARNQFYLIFIKRLLQKADALVCYSKKEQSILETFTQRRVIFIPLGIDTIFFKPDKNTTKHPIDILAAGKDLFRDYSTLCHAVKNTTWKTTIACSPENIRGINIPKNVTLIYNATPQQMKQLYNQAKLVVVPMKQTHKTQGQVVFMEAAAMNKQIIASRVSGITHAYDLSEYDNLILVKPESPTALKKEIQRQLASGNSTRSLKSILFHDSISIQTYTNRLAGIIEQ